METFVDQRSRSALPSMIYTILKNALDLGSGSQLKVICSVPTILDELTDTNKLTTCLNFIFINSQNYRFSYHTTPNALLQIT